MMPNWKQIVREHLAVLRLPPEREIEIVEEQALHLEAAYEDALAAGLSEAEAEARAMKSYDWRLLECELSRAERPAPSRAWQPSLELIERKGGMRMESLLQDLRFGARMLFKQPGFTLIAVLTLALGIGANTAIFSLVDAVLLRSLPFPQPERIMTIWAEAPADGIAKQGLAPGNYSDLKAQQTVFEQMAALSGSEMNLTGAGEPERLEGFAVLDKEAFDILGVKPALGRLFLPDEYARGENKVLLISHGFWRQRFGAAADVLGKELVLNEEDRKSVVE